MTIHDVAPQPRSVRTRLITKLTLYHDGERRISTGPRSCSAECENRYVFERLGGAIGHRGKPGVLQRVRWMEEEPISPGRVKPTVEDTGVEENLMMSTIKDNETEIANIA